MHHAPQQLPQLLAMQQQQLQASKLVATAAAAAGVLCEGGADGKCGSSSRSGNRSLTLQLVLLLQRGW
jgi:hypothetical protein